MTSTIALPLWLLVLLSVLALLGLWLGVLAPLLSRLFYRRRQRAARKLDEQLEFGLSGYSVASRKDWLDRLLHDPVVVEVIERIASETGEPLEQVQSRARRDAEEIVPFFNVLLYFRIGYWLGRWVLRTMYWIRTRYSDGGELESIPRDSCVVLVSNHRSNLDPFMLIYMASRRSAVSYSAGEWARAWPFRYLLHAIGFYIVRRDGGSDVLHRTVLERYVYLAASHCIPQGLFLEGELSRDGAMAPLKLGLLSFLLRAQGQGNCRDIVFVPVGLNYSRIPEDKTLVAHQQQGFGEKSRFYASLSFFRFAVLMMPRMLGLSKPFGTAVANFGSPLSLNDWQATAGLELASLEGQERRVQISALGEALRERIEALVPVLPVTLLAQVLRARGDAGSISELQLKSEAMALAAQLSRQGLTISLEEDTADREFSQGLYLLLKRGIVEYDSQQRLRVGNGGEAMLDYYRRSIAVQAPLPGV